MADVKIHLTGHDLKQRVLVSEDIAHDCLLGSDFLVSHGTVIDLKNGMLHIGEGATPLRQL